MCSELYSLELLKELSIYNSKSSVLYFGTHFMI